MLGRLTDEFDLQPARNSRKVRLTALARTLSWRGQLWAWYLISTCALTGLYLFVPPFSGNGPLINALGLSGVIAIVVGIRMNKPRARAAWWCFAAGQFLFFCGDLYTYSYPKLFGADVGFPSIGDALYLAVYPVLMTGFVLLIKRRNPRPDRSALIDALILTIGFGLLSWVFLIAPNVHLSGLSWLAKGVSVAYPLGDVLLLAAVIRLAVDSGKRTPAFWLLVSSIVCLLATDSAYNYALLKDTYHHQLSFDAGWILYYLLWGAAALHPSMRALEEPAADPRTRLTPLRLILLAGACLIAPAIRFAQSLHNPDVLVLIVASAVLFLLVVARMAGLVRQEERVGIARARAARRGHRSRRGGRAGAGRGGCDLRRPPPARRGDAGPARPRLGRRGGRGGVVRRRDGDRIGDRTRDWLRRGLLGLASRRGERNCLAYVRAT